jgi:hypothetical protein
VNDGKTAAVGGGEDTCPIGCEVAGNRGSGFIKIGEGKRGDGAYTVRLGGHFHSKCDGGLCRHLR